MQETRPAELTEEEAQQQDKLLREYFVGKSDRHVEAKMNRRLREMPGQTLVRRQKIGRNDPCPCNSGLKFKKCCLSNAR